jgi:hypothetical protein
LTVQDNGGASATSDVQITVNAAPPPPVNAPPTANAGSSVTITLPTNNVTLTGTGSDADGTIASYRWTKVSGPAGDLIQSPNTAATNITNLSVGSFTYRLTVQDNAGASATSDVLVTVNAAPAPPVNQLPTANAGSNVSITLPVNSVTLTGTGSDADGTIASYSWTKVSGPAGDLIQSANTAVTNITNLSAGSYTYRLTVRDNAGASATSDVLVTVNAAPAPPVNQLPTANAGSNVSITLPVNSVTLTGSGSDADGTIASYSWTKVSGPAGDLIQSANTAATNITNLSVGSFTYRLTVRDNAGASATSDVQVTVNAAPVTPPITPPVNQAPTASAGNNVSITLPINYTTLNGSGRDNDGTIASYSWTKVSGPAGDLIQSANTAVTNITNLSAGSYTYRLTVQDNAGASATSDVQVTVNAAPAPPVNQLPTANAGSNVSITLPVNSVTLTGTGSDADGTIASYSWTKVSGPAGDLIQSANTAATNITNLSVGSFTYRLTVRDNAGASATSDVQVTVNAAPVTPPITPPVNQAPTASAGNNISITLPTNYATLNGSGRDNDGTIASYSWTKVSGPAGDLIQSANTAVTNITNLSAGTYTYRLTVQDNAGASASSDVQVIVNAAALPPHGNQAPTANAGNNVSITLPTNSVTLTGSGSDSDGTITSYQWSKVSGPTGGLIQSANTAATNITGLIVGVYTYRLTVQDNAGISATSDVQITVNPVPNQAPTANAGNNVSITLPTNSATLTGSGSDADGTITSYQWTKVSGPSGDVIQSANTAVTNISNLAAGAYTYRLTVQDNAGATATSDVQVTVGLSQSAPNQMPVANAGQDATLKLPLNSIKLNGVSSFDPDGSITLYSWRIIQGAGNGSIQDANTSTPVLTINSPGIYELELTVTDNRGGSATDKVIVTLEKVNQVPLAITTDSIVVLLPSRNTELDGEKSYDVDGAIETYKWTFVTGPQVPKILDPYSAKTYISNLVEGVYTFNLEVTDNDGAKNNKTEKVIVKGSSVNSIRLQIPLVNIYPNPATDIVNVKIETPVGGRTTLTFINANGKAVLKDTFMKGFDVFTQQVYIGKLLPGIYSIVVKVDNAQVVVLKLVVL